MSLLSNLFTSSIGRKLLVAISALGLVFFLFGHLVGNLLIFAGPEALNDYAVSLRSFPILLWMARVGLLSIFLLHLFIGIKLRMENRRARPQNYVYQGTIQASLASRSMALTGSVMLCYVVYHLLHFTFGIAHSENFLVKDDLGRHDVYSMVILSFRQPVIAIAYIFALFVTFLHLSHGIPSLFQSVGWNTPSNIRLIQRIGKTVAFFLFLGYASIPGAVYFGYLTLP